MSRDEETTGAVELANAGADIVGTTLGAGLGLLVGGPPGAFLGGATGAAVTNGLKRVGAELNSRMLGPRQRIRMGAALLYAADEISARIVNGELVREDRFFEARG
jgi:hypothetical protein